MTTKINYTGISCIPPKDDTIRYVLKKAGSNPLFVIGLNTSTADETKPDQTVSRAMAIAAEKKFDGFVMFNLYPLRETDPEKLPEKDTKKLLEKNIAAIQKELSDFSKPTILAAWGVNIEEREYLVESLQKIAQLEAAQGAAWKHYGDLTKDGHPRHLSRVEDGLELGKFDLNRYLKELK
jgi:hypothetical protein